MSLSDVVAGSGLSLYPLVGLVLFFVTFVGIAAYVGLRRRETWDRVSRLPLEDDPPRAGERTMNQPEEQQFEHEDRLLDHLYDGIQEYDNPLPRWWVILFWISIFFTPLYILYYHAGPGLLDVDAYNKDMVAFYDLQAQQLLAMGPIDEQMLTGLQSEDAMMAGASQVFQVRCSSCHGQLGEGSIGPNLTDDYWLHGGNLTDILKTVTEGVPAKGMLAWKSQLSPAELLSVSAYVGTMRGTEPPRPKAPQGDLQPYDPQAAAADAEPPAPEES